jgi:hypothetical protein
MSPARWGAPCPVGDRSRRVVLVSSLGCPVAVIGLLVLRQEPAPVAV